MANNKYNQGKYTPRNPGKYQGDPTKIFYRSGWELKLFIWLDNNPACLKWGSEELCVPYVSPVDGRAHRYFPDVLAIIRQADGSVKKFVLEVKPLKETKPPRKSKNQKSYISSVQTYMINEAKWKSAIEWCKKRDYEFHLVTEKDLHIGN